MDYKEYLPYLEDSVDELLDNFQVCMKNTSHERRLEINNELKMYFDYFKKDKEQNPSKSIDDHVGAILLSYMLNPELDITDRDAHYNGVWYAIWGNIHKQSIAQIKAECVQKNPNDERWTKICLSAVDEYYRPLAKPSLFMRFIYKLRNRKKNKRG